MRLKLDQIRRDRLDELFRILSNNLRIQGTGRETSNIRFISVKNNEHHNLKGKIFMLREEWSTLCKIESQAHKSSL